MKNWRGVLETFEECEAETEEEAMEKMANQLIERLKSRETKFIVWDE